VAAFLRQESPDSRKQGVLQMQKRESAGASRRDNNSPVLQDRG